MILISALGVVYSPCCGLWGFRMPVVFDAGTSGDGRTAFRFVGRNYDRIKVYNFTGHAFILLYEDGKFDFFPPEDEFSCVVDRLFVLCGRIGGRILLFREDMVRKVSCRVEAGEDIASRARSDAESLHVLVVPACRHAYLSWLLDGISNVVVTRLPHPDDAVLVARDENGKFYGYRGLIV